MKFATKKLPERPTSAVFRDGAALLLVIAAALITNPIAREIDTTPLFYAVCISSWYGGVGPGFLAVLASRWSLQRDEDGTPVRILEAKRTEKISSRMDTSDR